MTSLKLTDRQLDYFSTFGFLSFPGLLADPNRRNLYRV